MNVAVLFAALGKLSVAQQDPAPVVHARVVTTPPVIDGRLTDLAWSEATPITGFVQRELHEGAPVTERTEVRIISDREALYIGAWLYDGNPGGIVPGEQVRDVDISKSDYFGVLLDTYHDRQNGFAGSLRVRRARPRGRAPGARVREGRPRSEGAQSDGG